MAAVSEGFIFPAQDLQETQIYTQGEIQDALGIDTEVVLSTDDGNEALKKLIATQGIVMRCRADKGFTAFLKDHDVSDIDQMSYEQLAGLESGYEQRVLAQQHLQEEERKKALEQERLQKIAEAQEIQRLALQRIAEVQEQIVHQQIVRAAEEDAYTEAQYRADRDEAYEEKVQRDEIEKQALIQQRKAMAVTKLKDTIATLREEEVLPADHPLFSLDDEELLDFLAGKNGAEAQQSVQTFALSSDFLQLVPAFSSDGRTVSVSRPKPAEQKKTAAVLRLSSFAGRTVTNSTTKPVGETA